MSGASSVMYENPEGIMHEIDRRAQTMESYRKNTKDLPLNQTGHRIQHLPLQMGQIQVVSYMRIYKLDTVL
jgi:hypothetical protein